MDYSWRNFPMAYIILRTIELENYMELFQDFVAEGFHDLWFPFAQENIPEIVRGPSARKRFFKAQRVVTGTFGLEKGRHYHLMKDNLDANDNIPKPLQWQKFLGKGGFGQVDKVVKNGESFALKRIPRDKVLDGTQNRTESFMKELKALKRLKHRHIIKLVSSYTEPTFLGLIMSPVADCDLADFLAKLPGSNEEDRRSKTSLLWSYFGCLTNAIFYLHHSKDIRHKDIKPKNILLKGPNVLLTDFGISHDWSESERLRSTTRQERTRSPKYCSPEVAKDKKRGSSSDIWSLGCVFLEMMTVLKGNTVENMTRFFEENGSETCNFWENPIGISKWMIILRENRDSDFENLPLVWIEDMLQEKVKLRPTALELRKKILNTGPHPDSRITLCGICCGTPKSETDSEDIDSEECTNSQSLASIELLASGADIDGQTMEIPTVIAPLTTSATSQSSLPLRAACLEQIEQAEDDVAALWLAALEGNEMEVWLLLKKGVDVKAKDNTGRTALHIAAENGNEAVVRLLLEQGSVDPDSKNQDGGTPLLLAAGNGHTAVAQLLLPQNNVNPNSENNWGWTPLQLAANNGHKALVEQLLTNGSVDPNSENSWGWTALTRETRNGHEEMVKLLLLSRKELNPNSETRYGWTPLSRAAAGGHEGLVRLLVEYGAKAELRNKDGRTPLHLAAENGHPTVAQQLLQSGAVVNSKDNDGRTALHESAKNGHQPMVRLLLKEDADIDAKNNRRQTALHEAAGAGHKAIIGLLLDNGADIDAKDRDGRTALHEAAWNGHKAIAGLLRDKEADVTIKDNDGLTAVELAIKKGHKAVVQLLAT
jgi:ankyrin repeat protein